MLMANTAEDAIVPFILPFVTEHIKNPDWKYRDAAVYAFGEHVCSVTGSKCYCVSTNLKRKLCAVIIQKRITLFVEIMCM